MKAVFSFFSLGVLCTISLVFSCKPKPETLEAYQFHLPKKYFPDSVPQSPDNKATVLGVELGRMLFYDTRLSANGKVSCATCHKPEKFFTDGLALSTLGVTGEPMPRHTPTLVNTAYSGSWFWDGGAKNLESQAFGPLTAKHEMGFTSPQVEKLIRQDETYKKLFKIVFKTEKPETAHMLKAIAQFESTLLSFNSKYDKYVRRDRNYPKFTADELEGMHLFNIHCQRCHKGELFTDGRYHNIGLDAEFSDTSFLKPKLGRFRISADQKDLGAYKTPTLRNIAFTAPYMHDGRHRTLDQVMDFYRNEVKWSNSLSPQMQMSKEDVGLGYNRMEQEKIIAFLKTLTDTAFLSKESFKNPR